MTQGCGSRGTRCPDLHSPPILDLLPAPPIGYTQSDTRIRKPMDEDFGSGGSSKGPDRVKGSRNWIWRSNEIY